MSFNRGTYSYKGSFLREPNLALPVCGGHRDDDFFSVALARDSKGNLKLGRKTISEMMNKKDYRGHIMLNAINLKDYSLDDVLMYLDMFKEYLEDDLGLSGILECHAGRNPDGQYIDETHSSFHYHFWCSTAQAKNKDVRYAMSSWIVNNGLALAGNVNIQKFNANKKINLSQLQSQEGVKPVGEKIVFDRNTMKLKKSKNIIVAQDGTTHNLQEDEDGNYFYRERTNIKHFSEYVKFKSIEYIEDTIEEPTVFIDNTSYNNEEDIVVKPKTDNTYEELNSALLRLKDLINNPTTSKVKPEVLPDQSIEAFDAINTLKDLVGLEELDARYEAIENRLKNRGRNV